MKKMYIGSCPICKQGMLEIVKEVETGIYFICCDECEAEWEDPEYARENVCGTRDKYGRITEITIDEVKSLKWEKYLI